MSWLRHRRHRLAADASLIVALLVAGCAPAQPDDVEYTLVAEGEIVAMDSAAGVYVEGTSACSAARSTAAASSTTAMPACSPTGASEGT